MKIPGFDLGGNGSPLHFLHANGYPPDCYKPLLELLQTRYHSYGMFLRPLWPTAQINDLQDWHPLSDDLLAFVAAAGSDPVIGVGHSIGAIVTLRAALRVPKIFRALVLIEPVLFVPARLFAWNLMRAIGLEDRVHPLITGARKRRRFFDDLESAFRGYRTRQVFRYMTDEYLRICIEGITVRRTDARLELAFTPEWEAHIYRTGLRDRDLWRGLPRLEVPTLIIRGAESDTFLEGAAKLVRRKNPMIQVETLKVSTHLLPLERPTEVFAIMQSFLQEVL